MEQKPSTRYNAKAKAQHGGPRKAGPGKKMGRPRLFAEPMEHSHFRLPRSWIPQITDIGEGDFAEGLRRIIQRSGIT